MGLLSGLDSADATEQAVKSLGRNRLDEGTSHNCVIEYREGILWWDGNKVTLHCPAEANGSPVFEPDPKRHARLLERLSEHTLVRHLLASPDICHRVRPEGQPTAHELGYMLTCDPSLPPNTIAIPDVKEAGG